MIHSYLSCWDDLYVRVISNGLRRWCSWPPLASFRYASSHAVLAEGPELWNIQFDNFLPQFPLFIWASVLFMSMVVFWFCEGILKTTTWPCYGQTCSQVPQSMGKWRMLTWSHVCFSCRETIKIMCSSKMLCYVDYMLSCPLCIPFQ